MVREHMTGHTAGAMGRKSCFDGESCLVIAHRGASASHAENTLPAFRAAIDAGADAVELDVRVTSDGVGVAIHDPDVSRTTDGEGLVHELSLGRVRELSISSPEGPAVRIPTLDEVVALVGERAGIMFEIKNLPGLPGFDPFGEPGVEETLRAISEGPVPALVASFNPRSIERCRDMARERVQTGFLSSSAMDPETSIRYAASSGHRWILPNITALRSAGEEVILRAHASGIRVGCWVADDPADIEMLISWGVDAVITNVPEIAVPLRDRLRDGLS